MEADLNLAEVEPDLFNQMMDYLHPAGRNKRIKRAWIASDSGGNIAGWGWGAPSNSTATASLHLAPEAQAVQLIRIWFDPDKAQRYMPFRVLDIGTHAFLAAQPKTTGAIAYTPLAQNNLFMGSAFKWTLVGRVRDGGRTFNKHQVVFP